MSSHGANAYLKWYVRDFRSSRKVQRMDYIARGLYRELLDEEFLEGSLPSDIPALADICDCPVEVMENTWPQIKSCFQEVDGKLFNNKLESMRTEQDKIRVKRAEAGRRGGIAKQVQANAKQVQANAKQVANGSEQMTYSRAEQSKEEQASATAFSIAGTERSNEDIDPAMVTSAVMDDLGLSGRDLRIVLDDVCSREMKHCAQAQELRERLVAAYKEYEQAAPRLQWTAGAEKFFGELWSRPERWPWKEGESSRSKVVVTAASDFVRPVRVKPIAAIRAEGGIQ